MAKKNKEILIWSDNPSLITSYLTSIDDHSVSTSNLTLTRNITPQTKAFIFLYSEEQSLQFIQDKSSEVFIPKFVFKIIGPGTTFINSQSIQENTRGSLLHHLTINLENVKSLESSLEFVSISLERGYKFLSMKLSYRGILILKWGSFIFSLASAILALLVIFLAGILTLSMKSTRNRWFSNSLLTAGSLTFVMSFVGFYGVKKTGIKEYLKIYSWVLIFNSVYKIVLITIYSFIHWDNDTHYVLVPFICTSAIFEILTACIILVELNVVKSSKQL